MLTDRSTAVTGKLNAEFLKMSPNVTEAYIAVGMITEKAFDFFERNLKTGTTIRVVVGVHMPTPPTVMEKLYDLEQSGRIVVKVFASSFFHPKSYLLKTEKGLTAFVGSGNLTHGGWSGNEELFVRISDQATCQELFDRFLEWEAGSMCIDRKFLDKYAENFEKNNVLESEKIRNTNDFVDHLTVKPGLDQVDFSRQFFKKSDFMTFDPSKISLDNKEIWAERAAVRNKLYKLNALVAPRIPASWKIYPHYIPDYIASQIETEHHEQHLVRSLWVGYGRDQPTLKMYGDHQTTPLYFMRMQFIIHHATVGFWLMPAKAHAGKVDRLHFAEQMKEPKYRELFFQMVTALGEPYWVDIAGKNRKVSSFSTTEELHAFMKLDVFSEYFIIGRDYQAGDLKLAVDRITETCLEEFTKYYPLYEMILHRL